jgi:hypothetical protein
MGLLAHAYRPIGLTLGRPPYFSLSSLEDVIPMVSNHTSSPIVLGKRALL